MAVANLPKYNLDLSTLPIASYACPKLFDIAIITRSCIFDRQPIILDDVVVVAVVNNFEA